MLWLTLKKKHNDNWDIPRDFHNMGHAFTFVGVLQWAYDLGFG